MKIFLRILLIALIITGLIFGARAYNTSKYEKLIDSDGYDYYDDPTNIGLYPKDLPGVKVEYVDSGRVQGFHLLPEEKTKSGLVITFGGSEGTPYFEEAQRLASEGYETLALFFFGMKNQEETLVRIPLEIFEDVLAYVDENIEDSKPLTVIGASKGAEFALNLGAKYDRIDNLILFAPSAYNFAGLDFNSYGSSWTYQGVELPYIDIKRGSFGSFLKNLVFDSMVKAPVAYRDTYKSAIEKDEKVGEKLIPLTNTKAKILLLAGEEDQMWPSEQMAETIKSQRPDVEIHTFPDAGHIFSGSGILGGGGMYLRVGGSEEGNKRAGEEAKKIVDDFLEKAQEAR